MRRIKTGSTIYIPGIDAKDIYITNRLYPDTGYSLVDKDGKTNYRRYTNTLDYSLDQIKLREVYEKVYRRSNFSFYGRKKEYTSRVINVTFKYSVSEFNKLGKNRYIKFGYKDSDLVFKDSVALVDGELAGITLGTPVESPISDKVLGESFGFEGGTYIMKKIPRTLKSTAELRQILYNEGFVCGGVRYVRWKRSSGSSRVGKCLFIDEKLYSRIHRWEMCGLKVKDGDAVDLAGLESYISLPSSSIVGLLDIKPENILVIDDYESKFTDRVISVTEDGEQLVATEKEELISNSIWDGQGLIDRSAMGCYCDKGMILLRNLFFKCCCFNTNLQKWFADNGITAVSQLNGYTQATRIEDIKLITTPSSIKYLKFGGIEQWMNHIDNSFGVVKYDKPTHFFDGRMVQTHYQLLNSLQMDKVDTEAFLKETFDYMTALKNDPAVLRNHIKYPIDNEFDISPAESKNDVVYKLLGLNDRFADTKLYHDFRADIIKSFTKNLRLGHVLVNGNYETLLGNPVEMLLSAIGRFSGDSILGVGNIHTKRFGYNQNLVGSRSPHISMSNVWVPRNVENEEIDQYFNLTNEIVCINSINENVLNRLSGCDFDSDSILITDNPHILKSALKNNGKFLVAVADVSSVKRKRMYTHDEQVDLDVKTSNNLIGDIINLSQELNTRIWDSLNRGGNYYDIEEIYRDVCILNVMSGIEIDKAKKEFSINNAKELRRLRDKYKIQDDSGRAIKPNFFKAKDMGKGYYDRQKKNYKKHLTTMDHLQTCVNSYRSRRECVGEEKKFLPFSELIRGDIDPGRRQYAKVTRVINAVSEMSEEIKRVYASEMESAAKSALSSEIRQECIEHIGNMPFTQSDMVYLLKQIEKPCYSSIKRKIFNILFGYPNTAFYGVLKSSVEPIAMLVEDDCGDVELYGTKYTRYKHFIP